MKPLLADPDDRNNVAQAIIEALGRPKGAVPQGLEYFAYPNFEKRLHSLIDEVLAYETNHE